MTTQNNNTIINLINNLLQQYDGYDNNTNDVILRRWIRKYNNLYNNYYYNYSDTFRTYNIKRITGHTSSNNLLSDYIQPAANNLTRLINNRNNRNNILYYYQYYQNNTQQTTQQNNQLDDQQNIQQNNQLDDQQNNQEYNYYFSFIMLLTTFIMITLNIFLIFFMRKSKVLYIYLLDDNINIIYMYK